MVEVYVTNVTKKKDSVFLKGELLTLLPTANIHFDLQDCDRILRIESLTSELLPELVISCLQSKGFKCERLTD